MAGELSSSEATVGWSRRNVADVAIALIGFGVIIAGANSLVTSILRVSIVPLPGLRQNLDKSSLMLQCSTVFSDLFVGLWLVAHHKKISARLFRAEPGAPLAERRAALAFGIKVYALYLAATLMVSSCVIASRMILRADRRGVALYWTLPSCLVGIAVCLYFLKRPGWLVSFAYPEGAPDEDA
jgi:hypothetical protein